MPEKTTSEIIKMDDVCLNLDNKQILKGLFLSVNRGDKILIKGRSGTGKTTIFRSILGFQPLSSGTILFQGEALNSELVWDIRKKIAYVSQESDIGEGVVIDMVKEMFSYRSTANKFDNKKLLSMLNELSLQDSILHKKFESLSGGEKQRLAISISILTQKDIFFLDEVTSDLDSTLKKKVIDMFLSNPQWTVISISHDREWEREGVKIFDFGKLQEGE